jgi:hypothetical protein
MSGSSSAFDPAELERRDRFTGCKSKTIQETCAAASWSSQAEVRPAQAGQARQAWPARPRDFTKSGSEPWIC